MSEGSCGQGSCACKSGATSETATDRRTLLAGAAALGVGAQVAGDGLKSELFLAEEHWRERMQAPDDGKRYGWVVDVRRCFGCHGCEVACKAENDVPLGHYIRQTIYHDYEKPGGGVARVMVSMACQHCEIFAELALRIGGGMEQWYPEGTDVRAYMEKWVANVPHDPQYGSPLEFLAAEGAYEDPKEKPYYEPYLEPLAEKDLEGAAIDEATGLVTKDGKGLGIVHRGKPVVGFKTPSRKLEVRSAFVRALGRNQDVSALAARAGSSAKNRPAHHAGHDYDVPELPTYRQIEEHLTLGPDELVMTSFKWNVHNHGRTANLKWLSEIVHSNPAWIHPDTAARLDLRDGDFVELRARRSVTVDKLMPSSPLKKVPTSASRVSTGRRHPRRAMLSGQEGRFRCLSVAFLAPSKRALPRDGTFSTAC
jgi:ferredoxin